MSALLQQEAKKAGKCDKSYEKPIGDCVPCNLCTAEVQEQKQDRDARRKAKKAIKQCTTEPKECVPSNRDAGNEPPVNCTEVGKKAKKRRPHESRDSLPINQGGSNVPQPSRSHVDCSLESCSNHSALMALRCQTPAICQQLTAICKQLRAICQPLLERGWRAAKDLRKAKRQRAELNDDGTASLVVDDMQHQQLDREATRKAKKRRRQTDEFVMGNRQVEQGDYSSSEGAKNSYGPKVDLSMSRVPIAAHEAGPRNVASYPTHKSLASLALPFPDVDYNDCFETCRDAYEVWLALGLQGKGGL